MVHRIRRGIFATVWNDRSTSGTTTILCSRKFPLWSRVLVALFWVLSTNAFPQTHLPLTSVGSIHRWNMVGRGDCETPTMGPFESLQEYVASIVSPTEEGPSAKDKNDPVTCKLIPARPGNLAEKHTEEEMASLYASNATILPVNTLIFRPKVDPQPTNTIYAVAILPSTDKVDVRAFSEELVRIQQQGDSEPVYRNWELAPSHIVQDLCGFAPGSIPPLLAPVQGNGESTRFPRPYATILDSSLWNITSAGQHLFLGGGGNSDFRCLVDAKFLFGSFFGVDPKGMVSTLTNVKVASILRFEGGMKTSMPIEQTTLLDQQPFFQIAPPASSFDFVPEDKSPHVPVPVTAIGRLSSVRRIAKKLVFADFAPPHSDWEARNDPSHKPWRSGEDGRGMYVQIIVGKTFCERFDDGIERLKDLKPGRLVLIRGASNVDPMQKNGWRNSAGNWAQKRSLDVIVSSFQILDEDEEHDSLRWLVRDAKENQWNALLPWERKRRYEQRAVAGIEATMEETPSPSLDCLTLDRFNACFQDTPLTIEIVDNEESIRAMNTSIAELFARIKPDPEFLEYVAGIDCEWRPTGAYAEALLGGPDDNPVALLQICIPSMDKVYLVDTHLTLRSGLIEGEPMNEMEGLLSKTVETLFDSEVMIKVGYGVAIDFRRLAASFPHIPAFRTVRSVVELSTLAQKLHPKSARPLLGSLQRLTKLVLGYNLAKEEQCSDWESRPMSPNQIEYAALDCALPPRLLDQMTEGTGTAKMQDLLPQVATTWRFSTLASNQVDAIRVLKAKRVVGTTFVVSQSWLQSRDPPAPISLPVEGGGPYTDKSGTLKMPSHLVGVANNADRWKKFSGKPVGKSKNKCIDLMVGDAIPEGATLEYNPRSGYIPFRDGVALFVNLPDPDRPSRRMPYPNEWLEDGRILTWYIRPNDWDEGRSPIARLLLGEESKDENSSVVLFVRIGNGEFVCCGNCRASSLPDSHAATGKKLMMLHLHLEEWDTLREMYDFEDLLRCQSTIRADRQQEGDETQRLRLARMIVDGNVIGALNAALETAKIDPTERSLETAVQCLQSNFGDSQEPMIQKALEIIRSMRPEKE